MVQGNNQFRSKRDGDVASVIWEKVAQFGFKGVEKDEIYVEKIIVVEKKVHERRELKEANSRVPL